MRYWIIKGSPSANDWDKMLVPEKIISWQTRKLPKNLLPKDRVFFWESTPKLRIIGLGVIVNIDSNKNSNNYSNFRIKSLVSRLVYMPTIKELRTTSVIKTASFLKVGPAMGVFPISNEQAQILFNILASLNSEIKHIWSDLVKVNTSNIEKLLDIDELEISALEGKQRLITHLHRERNRKVINAKKNDTLMRTGRLSCEACGFDFQEIYGKLGKEFCEVHHKKALSSLKIETKTKINDLAILCSNCHRMIHRSNPMLSIESLKRLIKSVKT